MIKSYIIFCAFVLHIFSVYAQPNSQLQELSSQQPHQSRNISITINSHPHSGCNLDNSINQEAQHASSLATKVDTALEQNLQEPNNSHSILSTIGYACLTAICPVGGLIAYYIDSRSNKKRN